jgi:hypothetical protein
LNRINEIINGGDFELGKVAPWLTNLFFTGENYLTPQSAENVEKQRKVDELTQRISNYATYTNINDTNPLAGTEEGEKLEKQRAYSKFDKEVSNMRLPL